MPKPLSPEVQDFIQTYIDSLEELEVLLVLSASPHQAWTVERVYEQVRSNADSIRRRLEQLVALRLVARAGVEAAAYQYQPNDPKLIQAVDQLSIAYRERRVLVVEHIFSKPLLPIKGFADAFRIRKDETNG